MAETLDDAAYDELPHVARLRDLIEEAERLGVPVLPGERAATLRPKIEAERARRAAEWERSAKEMLDRLGYFDCRPKVPGRRRPQPGDPAHYL